MKLKSRLILLLLAVVVAGIFLLSRRGTPTEKTPEDTMPEIAPSVEKEKDSEEEEFYYTEELVLEGKKWGMAQLVFLHDEECIVKHLEGEDGQKYLTVLRIRDNKELFTYPKQGEVAEGFVVYSNVLYFLEYRKTGEMNMIGLDGTGKKICEVPVKERDWGSFSEEGAGQKYYVWTIGADDEFFYIKTLELKTKRRKFEIYRWDGTLFQERKSRMSECFFVDGKGNYYIYEQGRLSKFRTSDGEMLYEEKVSRSWEQFWLDKNLETFYIVSKEGVVISYDLSNGQEKDAMMTFGVDTSYILLEDCMIIAGITNGEDVYVHVESLPLFMGGSGERTDTVYKYTKVHGKRPARTNILTVAVPYETEALRQAKIRYEMRELDTEVRFESKYNDVNGFLANREQYQEQLRMKMAAGDLPDLIEVGHAVDFLTMAKSDIFLDLKPYLEKSEIKEKLPPKMIKMYERDGTMRGIPTEYVVHYYQFNRETAKRIGWTKDPEEWKWSDLLSLAKKLEEEDSSDYLFTDPGALPYRLINIVRANFPDMVDYEKKTVNFHQDWFVDLLKQLKEVNGSFNIAYDISRNPVKNPAWDMDFMGDGMLYQEWRMSKIYDQLIDDIQTAEKRDVILVKNIRGEKNANRRAQPLQVFSISANSSQKDRAFRFLETLLDFGAQKWCEGLPMNADAMNREWYLMRSRSLNEKVVNEYEKMHREIIGDIDLIYANDYAVSAALTPLQEYLEDKLTLDEALTKAENDVRIILNE